MTTTTTRDPFGPEGVKARQDWEDGAAADIEQWYWVRARWVVDLLRSGMNVAVIGVCGMGKSTVMHYVEKTMLPEHDGLTDRVRFFYEWKGCGRLPKRSRRAVRGRGQPVRRNPRRVRRSATAPAVGTGQRAGPVMSTTTTRFPWGSGPAPALNCSECGRRIGSRSMHHFFAADLRNPTDMVLMCERCAYAAVHAQRYPDCPARWRHDMCDHLVTSSSSRADAWHVLTRSITTERTAP